MSRQYFEPFALREAHHSDLDGLLDLEVACFTSPWTREAFEQEVELPQAELWIVSEEDDGPPCAYVNFWIAAGEVSLLNVAVHPSQRRRGLAGRLRRWMEERGREGGGESVFLEVRRSNAAGLALYLREGYDQVGIRKGYYGDNGEDAIVMSKTLDGGSKPL